MIKDRQGSRILIVEDEVFVAWDEAQTLTSAGYDIIGPAHDLSTALEYARNETPCAAVLDINLGNDMVWEVAEKLRSLGVPFAFVTADMQHSELHGRYATTPRLSKPVSEQELIDTVDSLLD